jgi:acyl transferase domain-containing protein
MIELADRIVALAASTPEDLREAAGHASTRLGQADPPGEGRCRLAVVAEQRDQLRRELAGFAAGDDAPNVISHAVDRPLRLAFLFTGQGSQYPGMGQGLYRAVSSFRAALDYCANRLHPDLPLLEVIFGEQSGDALRRTGVVQPVLFALEYALSRMWGAWGVQPQAVLGHSVGEYVAATIAGCVDPEQALRLVSTRGRLMQSLPAGGAMVGVIGPPDVVRDAAARDPAIAIAAVNGPNSLVLSGAAESVQAVCAELTADGLLTQPLSVSHAFHSPLMDPILAPFERAAREVDFRRPRLDLVCDLSGRPLGQDEHLDARYWRRHLRETVQFEAGVRALAELGCTMGLELGPRPTLVGMARKCLPRDTMSWVTTLRPGMDEVTQVLRAAAGLYVHGAELDWRRMAADMGSHADSRRQ